MSKWKRDSFLKRDRRWCPNTASPFSSKCRSESMIVPRHFHCLTFNKPGYVRVCSEIKFPLFSLTCVQLKIRVLKVNKDWTLVSSPCNRLPITEACACFMTVLFSYSLWHMFVCRMNKSDESAHPLSVIEQSW